MASLVPLDALIADEAGMVSGVLNNALVCLMSGNYTPVAGSTLADLLANEASFTGYSRQVAAGWSTPADDGSGQAKTFSSAVSFTPTSGGGSGNLYGAFLVNAAATALLAAVRFSPAPITVPQSVALVVTPTALLKSQV